MLRSDPANEVGCTFLGGHSRNQFRQDCHEHGVIVLNDPNGLAKAVNKMYFQLFPEEVRPQTMITRDLRY